MSAFFFVLMGLAMALTLGVLFTGLIAMARGGDFNRKYSNKLMRMRILAQGLALVFFAVAMMIGAGD